MRSSMPGHIQILLELHRSAIMTHVVSLKLPLGNPAIDPKIT